MLLLEKPVQMPLRQEKKKGCVCACSVSTESVLLTARVVGGFVTLLEAQCCGQCPPCHASLGAGRNAGVRRKANAFCLIFPNDLVRNMTWVYWDALNSFFALWTGAKIFHSCAVSVAYLWGCNHVLALYSRTVNHYSSIHTARIRNHYKRLYFLLSCCIS